MKDTGLRMPTPIEDHGGVAPGPFHTIKYPSKQPRCLIFVTITQDHLSFDLFKSCLLDRVSAFIYCLPGSFNTSNLIDFHPLIRYMYGLDTHEAKLILLKDC
jgi:hypothetical protein